MVSLYCTNQKGRELIANVQIVSLDASNYIDTLSKIEVLLISDYTKDPLIIEQEPNVHLLPATDIDLKAITKFEEYLHGRKKAGVVRIDERNRLYILPSGEAKLRCILFEKVIPSSNRMPSSSAPKETHNPASNLQVEDAEEDSKAPTTQGTQAEAIKHAKV